MTLISTKIKSDRRFMRTALTLANRGLGITWPNPSVGCVLVREDLKGRIVGRGWTQKGGRPHAETEALRRAGDMARGATAFVTLEPCCHKGKTEPCTDALIDAGIIRVVVAMIDPDPRVAGKGLKQLRDYGIEVEIGIRKDEAEELNLGFNCRKIDGRPLTTLKVATTSDGCVATRSGKSQWITGSSSRRYGHMLRARHDAILTGIGTIKADDPILTCRLQGLEHLSPIRIIMDTHGQLTANSAVMVSANQAPVWRFHASGNNSSFLDPNLTDFFCSVDHDGHIPISEVLSKLAHGGITRLLVEAGPQLTTAFLKSGYVDQIYWFRSASIMGGDGQNLVDSLDIKQLTEMPEFKRIETLSIDNDNLEVYRRRRSA